jgi:hypothetical protein
MPKKGSYINLSGQKFGRLTAVQYKGVRGRRRTYWECHCDCGNVVYVDSCHLRSGHTTSCGCLKVEKIERLNKKTGLSTSKLYYAYRNMLNRCFYKKLAMYQEYGARGITVCDEWIDKENGFKNFVEWAKVNGYSEDLTLDRIDVNGNYEPSNCRWVDLYVQANNKRNNLRVKINGEIDTVGNWARKMKLDYWALVRYSKGGKNMKYPNLNIEAVNV